MTSPEIKQKEKIIGAVSQILGADDKIDINIFYQEVEKSIPSDISPNEIFKVAQWTATSLLEKDPVYDKLAAGFLLYQIYGEIFGETAPDKITYQQLFINNIKVLVEKEVLDKRLLEFD